MRKFILLMLFITTITNAQEYKLEEKTVTGIFEANQKTKAELFSAINKWISVNYKSAKTVIQLNDLESGTIIVQGINSVFYRNNYKILYPKNSSVKEYDELKLKHTIEFSFKDNKHRIVYKIIGLIPYEQQPTNKIKSTKMEALTLDCINLNNPTEASILAYNIYLESILNVGKEKKEILKTETKPMFEDLV
jgi:Domain of unknown function (DUF4468) with TBP-like fold